MLEKEIYEVYLEPLRDIQWLLFYFTNNVNQIAKHVNQTGIIYKKDIEKIRSDLDVLSIKVWNIHNLLLKRTKEV